MKFKNIGPVAVLFALIDSVSSRVDSLRSALTDRVLNALGDRGQGSMISKIVGIAVGIVVVAIVFPIAFSELASATVPSEMTGVEPLLKTLLPVLAVIGVILYIVGDQI